MFKRIKNTGPGAMVAAAFIGPGTITTATLAGSSYGYTLLWAIVFSVFATYILQEMSARLGVVGRVGIATAIKSKMTHPFLKILISVLVLGAILVGNIAYEAGNITGATMGFQSMIISINGAQLNPLIFVIGIIAFALLYSGKYKLIEKSLVIMVSVMGLVFICSAILVQPDYLLILKGLMIPKMPKGAAIMVVGLIGTTVVPYNLFLHAAAVKEKWKGAESLPDAKWDTLFSILLGGVITMAILITSSAVFESNHVSAVNASVLSSQLAPLLGDWSSTFMAIGFLAAGISSSITAPLAAATVTSEIFDWKKSWKSRNFRFIWLLVLVSGLLFSSLGFKPTTVILFAQVANGLLLPIIAAFLLWVMNDKKIMGDNVNSLAVNILAGIVILITVMLGLKGVLSAGGFI